MVQGKAASLDDVEANTEGIPIADRTMIFDNSGERHKLILEITHGKIAFFADMPLWLRQVILP